MTLSGQAGGVRSLVQWPSEGEPLLERCASPANPPEIPRSSLARLAPCALYRPEHARGARDRSRRSSDLHLLPVATSLLLVPAGAQSGATQERAIIALSARAAPTSPRSFLVPSPRSYGSMSTTTATSQPEAGSVLPVVAPATYRGAPRSARGRLRAAAMSFSSRPRAAGRGLLSVCDFWLLPCRRLRRLSSRSRRMWMWMCRCRAHARCV